MSANQYDAIVIGGGHNGLVNAAYLAKAGLNTIVLERRHLVGGAAITEELLPGFHFTTFSYAISLLRPDIVHELDRQFLKEAAEMSPELSWRRIGLKRLQESLAADGSTSPGAEFVGGHRGSDFGDGVF